MATQSFTRENWRVDLFDFDGPDHWSDTIIFSYEPEHGCGSGGFSRRADQIAFWTGCGFVETDTPPPLWTQCAYVGKLAAAAEYRRLAAR